MSNKINHIALAVKNIKEVKSLFELLTGNRSSDIHEVTSQKVSTSFVDIGDTAIELLEPVSHDSPISKFLEDRGGGIHHLCIGTKNFDELIASIKARGIRSLGDPSLGAKGRRVLFFHPKDTYNILIELEEN